MWTRGEATATECPKSLITAESVETVERFYAWKTAAANGAQNERWLSLPVRVADGLMLLEEQWKKQVEAEKNSGT